MDQSTPEASVRVGAKSRPPIGPSWWALAFGGLTTAGLGVFAWALLLMHALGYGVAAVIAPETALAAPDGGRYGLAFGIGVIVNLATAAAMTRLASHTAIRTWPPIAQGLGTALIAAAVASCALLLTLDINPVDFLLAL